jgi:hypothetical protein
MTLRPVGFQILKSLFFPDYKFDFLFASRNNLKMLKSLN